MFGPVVSNRAYGLRDGAKWRGIDRIRNRFLLIAVEHRRGPSGLLGARGLLLRGLTPLFLPVCVDCSSLVNSSTAFQNSAARRVQTPFVVPIRRYRGRRRRPIAVSAVWRCRRLGASLQTVASRSAQQSLLARY